MRSRQCLVSVMFVLLLACRVDGPAASDPDIGNDARHPTDTGQNPTDDASESRPDADDPQVSDADVTPDGSGGADGGPAPQDFPGTALPLSHEQFIIHAYQVLFDRDPDAGGFEQHLAAMRQGGDRAAVFTALMSSSEFSSTDGLSDPTEFVRRCYRVLLQRGASDSEAQGHAGNLPDGNAAAAGEWLDAFHAVARSKEYRSRRRPVAGVHFPIPIRPGLDISAATFVDHAYAVVLGRSADAGGMRQHRQSLEGGTSRSQIFDVLISSGEFAAKPALADRAAYVTRVYETVLQRTPSADEVTGQLANLREANGSGSGITWYQFYDALARSQEFQNKVCHDDYYTYGRPLPIDTPLLYDVMEGVATMEDVDASPVIDLGITATNQVWDQKLGGFHDPQTDGFYAFTRGYDSVTRRFNVYLLKLEEFGENVRFAQVGDGLFSDSQTFYDAHIAIDNSVCPRRWVMTLECYFDGLPGASLCVSYSSTPSRPATWSRPLPIVTGCNTNTPSCGGRARSASTGMVLVDHATPYVSWTEVDDGSVWFEGNPDEGNERTSTSAIPANNLYGGFSTSVGDQGRPYILPTTPDVYCQSPWDCNNRDAQDWKREGPYYYAIYNGGNYYRCIRPEGDRGQHTSQWALSLARSSTALGEYPQYLDPAARIEAKRDNTCGISYPVIQEIEGSLVMTYAHYDVGGGNTTRMSRIEWVTE